MGNCRSDTVYETRSNKGDASRKVTLALLGLDNAGKTVTAKGFVGEPTESVTPTIGFSCVNFRFGKHDVTLFDLGGGRNIRGIWKNYFAEIYGLIFVIDASDPSRLVECQSTLNELLQEAQIHGKPLLVLANKQDIVGAMDEVDICDRIRLEDLVNAYKTPCRLESCSATLRKSKKIDNSITIGIKWLMETIEEKWSELEVRVAKDVKTKQEKDQQKKDERAERVRKSRELREKENINHNSEEVEDDIDGGNPFKPISSLKVIQENTGKRKSKTAANDRDNMITNSSTRQTLKFQAESSDEGDSTQASVSSQLKNVDDRARYSAAHRLTPRTSTWSNHISEIKDNERKMRTKTNLNEDSEEEASEMIRTPRLSYRKTKLDPPIPPTRIRNESSDSGKEGNDDLGQYVSTSIFHQQRAINKTVTPPVLSRTAEFDSPSKHRHHGLEPIYKEAEKKAKKKKLAKFNQTAPILEDTVNSWKEDSHYSRGYNSIQHHNMHQAKTQFDPDLLSSPVMQQNKNLQENMHSKWMKSSKSYEDDEDSNHKSKKISARNETRFNRMKPNYNFNSDSNDDVVV